MTSSRFSRPARTLLVLLLLMIALAPRMATAQSASGAIDGQVVDPSGAALPGVTVSFTLEATGATRTTVTDEGGLFSAPLLVVGVYSVTAELQGFETRKLEQVRLTVGNTMTLRIEMSLAGVSETVNVAGRAPMLETARSSVSATVGEMAIENLPTNGRNFIDFVLLTPGVTRDTRTGDLSFAGQRGTLNSLVIDGADNNNTFFGQTLGRTGSGRAPYQFSEDAVKEFQVNSNAFAAEYGRAGGAVINVVTKSGTNVFSGSVFEFYRDKALNANNTINKRRNLPKPAYHFNQFGGTLGGPIQRNRHFFFFNYDGQRNTQPNSTFLNLPASTPGDPLTQQAIAQLTPLATSWSRGLNQDVFLIKTDHELSVANRLSFRYNYQNFTGQGFENGGPQNSIEHTGDSLVKTHTFNAGWTGILGTTLFNEFRFQWARDKEPGLANSANPEATIFEGSNTVLVIGRNNFSPRETTIKRWQVADSVTWVRGPHRLKGGFDFQFDNILNLFPGFFSGAYTFRSLASYQLGRPAGTAEQYQQNFAGAGTTGPETRPNIREYSFFIQDEWRPAPSLTVNLGLRYDLLKTKAPPVQNPDPQLLAAGIDTSRLDADANNWGPRLGVVWGPEGKKYIIRGGLGWFYGRTPSIMLGTAHSNNGINIQSLTFTGSQVPTYPQKFDSIPTGGTAGRPTIFYVDQDFGNAKLLQANAAFEWEFVPETTLSVTYLFVDGSDLSRSIDRNLGTLGATNYTIAGTGETVAYHRFGADRAFSNFTRVIAFESTAESRYNGVTFEINRRFTDYFSGRIAYTLGKVEDTVPDATAVVPGNAGDDLKYASNPADFDADRTYGNTDQRHRLVVSAAYSTNNLADSRDGISRALIKGWTVAGIFTAGSGQPYSARVGANDLNGDGNTRNEVAPGTARNAFRLPTQVSLDPRLARDILMGRRARVQLIVEAFNLLNRGNISTVETALYSVAGTTLVPNASFGTPLTALDPRVIQLGVKLLY